MSMAALHARIKEHEGLCLKPYVDTLGHTTIGYGRNLDAKGISVHEADALLVRDVSEACLTAETLVSHDTWDAMGVDRRGVLIEMVFQMGGAGVAAFKKMLAALEDGDWLGASHEMLNSRWARQTPNRAEKLAEIMDGGD